MVSFAGDLIGDFSNEGLKDGCRNTTHAGGEMRRSVLSNYLHWVFTLAFFAHSPAQSQPPSHLWSHQSFGTQEASGFGVTVDAFGNVYVCGWFTGTVDLGGGTLTSAGDQDGFIAKYNAAGALIWSQRFGGPRRDAAYGVAVDPMGNVLVTGRFGQSVDFGGGRRGGKSDWDGFIAKYDPSGGHLWSRCFGDDKELEGDFDRDEGFSITVDDRNGAVLVTGHFDGEVNFGGDLLVSQERNSADIFLAKYDAQGDHLWSKSFAGVRHDDAWVIKTDGSGNVFLAGGFEGQVNFGGGLMRSAGTNDAFFATFNSAGVHQLSRRFGGPRSDICYGIAINESDEILLAGDFHGEVDFGGDLLASAGASDAFLVKLDAFGAHLWSQRFGAAGPDQALDVKIDASGDVLMVGRFNETVDFGGGPLTSAGVDDIFLAQYKRSGNHMWSRRYGDPDADVGLEHTIDGTGSIIVTGSFSGTLDFGGGPLTSTGLGDMFVAKFDPGIVPATLQAFESYWVGNHVEVAWRLIDVEGELSFEVFRMEGSSGFLVTVYGADVTRRGDEFIFEDHSTDPGKTYRYQVVIFEDGEAVTSFETTVATPSLTLTLDQNYPNPFNPSTRIDFVADKEQRVSLRVYDITGRLVTTLIDREMLAGTHSEVWDGRDANGNAVASGTYFFRLKAGTRTLTRKAVLLK